MTKENKEFWIFMVAVAFIILLFSLGPRLGSPNENWQEDYQKSVQATFTNDEYLEHTDKINIDESLKQVAQEISDSAINEKDAVRKTMEWVYQNIEYDSSISSNVCFLETSVDVVERGTGDCVSMTKVVISLLREQGIIARPAGGCISGDFVCSVLFSVNPDRRPKFEAVDVDDPKKTGGLHEWVEIWLPDEGWLIGEATSAQLFPKSCRSYDTNDYNTDPKGMCVVDDRAYRVQCKTF